MHDIAEGALHLAMQITGSRDEAMDILQSAVLKSMEHKNAPRPEEAGYRAWFYRVVHNQAIDWLRSNRKFVDNAGLEDASGEADETERQLDQERRKVLLHKALNSLKPEQREIICLKDFHDLSYDDIAEIMSIEKGTVMSRLHRARMALKHELVAMKLFPGDEHEV